MKYLVDPATQTELKNRFTYHPPKGEQPAKYESLRMAVLQLATFICELVPQSRERATALTHLDAAMMFANAGIARNEHLHEGGGGDAGTDQGRSTGHPTHLPV